MPRACRTFQPGLVWHLTHRCHNKAFLLKFERDRRRWQQWLFQARKRYGLSVLNYIATSNHIHLLVRDTGGGAIARSMQLTAGRVAQEYNRRKSRQGAFWEDRYSATAVATDKHLIQCLVYIDLNMVRAGAVGHPSQWAVSGYHDLQSPPLRYRIIDYVALCQLTDLSGMNALSVRHREWVDDALSRGPLAREPKWTEEPAVGPDDFVSEIAATISRR
jgi:putative transposase